MELYHGSDTIISTPTIIEPSRGMDYGAGFYCSTSQKQAENWVRNKFKFKKLGIVNIYSFDEEKAKTLKIKRFRTANTEWIDFVQMNRRNKYHDHGYDIVIGPIADDRVTLQFQQFTDGFISKETLIESLLTYRLTEQYLFHTPKAIECITFKRSEKIAINELKQTKHFKPW